MRSALAFVSGVPPWLLAGLFLGALFGGLILAAFLAGERLFPADRSENDRRQRGERLRREEIRYYLQAIDEPFEEDTAVEGREVAFHLPERDVVVTFDARSYLLLRDSSVHPILVEHEMPGVHLGTRLPFETPDVGFSPAGDAGVGPSEAGAFGSGAATDPNRDRDRGRGQGGDTAASADEVRTAYAVLGLPPGADEDAVESAYRERVKEAHPDHGGDRESFTRLREAYATVREEGAVDPGDAGQRSVETS